MAPVQSPARGVGIQATLPAGNSSSMESTGIVRVLTPAREQQRRDQVAADRQPPIDEPQLTGLVAELRKGWLRAKEAKQTVEREMIEFMRMREGEYSPEQLASLAEVGKVAVYAPICSKIVRAFEAWATEILFQSGDKPWGLDPTPITDLNPAQKQMAVKQAMLDSIRLFQEKGMKVTRADFELHIKNHVAPHIRKILDQQAKASALGMETKIEDQFEEGGFYKAMAAALSNIGTFHAGFIKGPVVRNKRGLNWVPDGSQDANGNPGFAPQLVDQHMVGYTAPHPLDIYPSASATDCQDGDMHERMRMQRHQLVECKGVEGFRDAVIDEVLDLYDNHGMRDWTTIDSERATLENRENVLLTTVDTIDVLDVWRNILGKHLITEGLTSLPNGASVFEYKVYEINAWLVKDKVMYLAFNDHPLGLRPYGKASYENIPGSFWGRGIPEKVATPQAMCNAAVTSQANNMGLTDGPLVAYDDIDRLPVGEDPTNIHGWKVYQFTNDKKSTNPPIQVIQINDLSEKYMAVYDKWKIEADELAGIPPYASGDPNIQGAGKTLGGLSILQGNASRGLRLVVSNIDEGIIKPQVYLTFVHNMLYDPDNSIKGDVRVVTRGALSLLVKEQTTARRMQFLQVTNNPVDMQIIGLRGRAKVLRGTVGSLDMDADDLIPTDEEMQAMEQAYAKLNALQNQQQVPGAPGQKQLPAGTKPAPA